jgi:hypothetical protein
MDRSCHRQEPGPREVAADGGAVPGYTAIRSPASSFPRLLARPEQARTATGQDDARSEHWPVLRCHC